MRFKAFFYFFFLILTSKIDRKWSKIVLLLCLAEVFHIAFLTPNLNCQILSKSSELFGNYNISHMLQFFKLIIHI